MFRRLLAAAVVAAATIPAFAGEETFALPAGAAMSLTVPDGWKHAQQSADPRAITLTPRAGRGFRVVFTPVLSPEGQLVRTDTQNLRRIAEEAAQKAQPLAQEQSLPLQFLAGGNGRGFYFNATLRTPGPDGLRHLTQGVMSVQGLPIAFAIRRESDDAALLESALQVLRGARRR